LFHSLEKERASLYSFPPLAKGGVGGISEDLNKPMLSYNKNLKSLSKNLRRNMTDAERRLWSKIRGKKLKGCQFYRQKPLGQFIADFYCPKANLVVELDGGQHYYEEGRAKDSLRDDEMKAMGLRVIRFSDRDVFKNLKGVVEEIWSNL
jgi:very-short-patch-repair endonuclease